MNPVAVALLVAATAGPAAPDDAPSPDPGPRLPARRRPAESVTRFDREALRASARPGDAWSLLRGVPGLVLDRVDVGGSGTALQSIVVSRGDPGSGVTWSLDGFEVTDPAAVGATSLFLDGGLLAAAEVTTHAMDVAVRPAGPAIAFHLPVPGERWSGGARAALALPAGDNRPADLAARSLLRDELRRAHEVRLDAGGPLPGGRLRAWMAVSRHGQSRDVSDGHRDSLSATSMLGRARGTAGGTRLDLLVLRNEKVHDERAPTRGAAPETRWRQSGPGWLVGLTAERGDWRARAGWLDAGFSLRPAGGPGASAWEDRAGVWHGSYSTFETTRPRLQLSLEGRPRFTLFGGVRRPRLGAEWKRSVVETRASWPGNGVLGLERDTVFFRAFGLSGFAIPTRAQAARSLQQQAGLFVEDEARRGRFRLAAGLRLDHLWGGPLPTAVRANPEFPDLLPAAAFEAATTAVRWTDVLPRLGADFALGPETTLSAGYAAYAAPLGSSEATFAHPLGREGASLTYFWLDRDGDHRVDAGELDLVRGRVGAAGLDPDQPASADTPHEVDPSLRAPRTHAVAAGVTHARGGVRAEAHASWRRLVHATWRPLRNLTLADYAIEGAARGTLFGDTFDVGYYAPANASRIVKGNGRVLANRPGYRQDTFTVELRLSGVARGARWEAFAAVHDWREWFSGTDGIQDPTPTEGEPLRDGGVVAVRAGGLGRDVFVNARWTAGASVRASLPGRLELHALAHARDGFPVPYVQAVATSDPTGGGKNVLVSPALDAHRLPAVALVDLRLARPFAAGPGTLTVAVEAFNALGAVPALQLARDVELPSLSRVRDIAPGRVARLSLDWTF